MASDGHLFVCKDLLYKKKLPFGGNLAGGCLRAWDRVLFGGTKRLPGRYSGRGGVRP